MSFLIMYLTIHNKIRFTIQKNSQKTNLNLITMIETT